MEPHARRALSVVRSRPLYVVPERRVARAVHVPLGRALHLIDLENLMGGPFGGRAVLRRAVEAYQDAAPLAPGDLVVIGTNPALAVDAALGWPGVRLVVGAGRDGADVALIDQVREAEWVASHFDRVVIGSGDGVFAEAAVAIRSFGVAVGVVANGSGLSRRLARVVDFIHLLPESNFFEVSA